MPEGHTIHRQARLQREALGLRPLGVSSPQGRFFEGARILDGRRLEGIDAYGKHLVYRFEARRILHVHLGLFGRFRIFRDGAPAPSPNARLVLRGDAEVHLSGPTICRVIDPAQLAVLRSRLGPDPLDPGADPAPFFDTLTRRTTPIGAALLDQSLIAGIGNVYRSELLFLTGLHPDRPAASLGPAERTAIWDRAVDLLADGERTGRIVTVDPRDVGAARRRDLPEGLRLYVYDRLHRPCRRCATDIVRWELGGRDIWACPSCQT